MSTKLMKILGIVFLILGIGGIAGGIFFWFFHYSAMQNGHYYYGDSLMVACTISLLMGLLIYPAVPLLIVSKVRKNRESAKIATNSSMYQNTPVQRVQPSATVNGDKFCIYCGAKHSADANFCINCGKKFN